MNISRLRSLSHGGEVPSPKMNISFVVTRNKVHPHAMLHTCIMYKDGTATLDTLSVQTWNRQDMTLKLDVDAIYRLDDISTLLLSPSCGEWTVPKIWLTDDAGNRAEFVATNMEGNCMYVMPEPFAPPSPQKIQEGLHEYQDMKRDILKRHMSFVGALTLLIHCVDPTDLYTKWFAVGGGMGLVYQLLMHMEIDQVGNSEKSIAYRLLANSFFRLSLIPSVFLFTAVDHDATVFATILAGFMMNKAAMYTTFWNMKK